MKKKTRIGALCLALAVSASLLVGSMPAVNASGTSNGFADELSDKYGNPKIENRTEVRWWMAEGGHTDETLEEEVQAIYDAGFRGIELCQFGR